MWALKNFIFAAFSRERPGARAGMIDVMKARTIIKKQYQGSSKNELINIITKLAEENYNLRHNMEPVMLKYKKEIEDIKKQTNKILEGIK